MTPKPTQPLPRAILDAISKVTTKVTTSTLERNGIQKLRILSESQFLEVLERHQARKAITGYGTGDEEPSGELARQYEERWEELRERHQKSLGQIEGRMEKLSKAMKGVHGLVEKLGPAAAPPTARTEPTTSPPQRSASPPDRQKALLRQLLLEGDEQGA